MDPFTIGLVLSALGTGATYVNNRKLQKKQNNLSMRNLRKNRETEKKVAGHADQSRKSVADSKEGQEEDRSRLVQERNAATAGAIQGDNPYAMANQMAVNKHVGATSAMDAGNNTMGGLGRAFQNNAQAINTEQTLAQDYARLYQMEQQYAANKSQNSGLAQFGQLASMGGSLMTGYGAAQNLAAATAAAQAKVNAANKIVFGAGGAKGVGAGGYLL